MSDDDEDLDDDPREFRSPFDLALDWAGSDAFKWLVLGHILFAAGLAVVLYFDVPNGSIWITPLFAIPFLWKGRRHHLVAKLIVFGLGFTAAHYLAVQAAISAYHSEATPMPGLAGGAVGAALSLAACAAFGLLRPGLTVLLFAAFGTVLLAAVGSFAVYLYLTTGAAGGTFFSELVQMLKIYTPWQIAFAYVLAKLLRPRV